MSKKCNQSTGGAFLLAFTLIEIMIVIALIGILVAISLPMYVKIREGTRRTGLINDARQLGGAAQQYMLEHVEVEVPLVMDTEMGRVSGSLGEYVRETGKGYSHSSSIRAGETFTLAHPQVRGGSDADGSLGAEVVFNADGSLYR